MGLQECCTDQAPVSAWPLKSLQSRLFGLRRDAHKRQIVALPRQGFVSDLSCPTLQTGASKASKA